jgi:caffeoyl-CoA O-methyltransferase
MGVSVREPQVMRDLRAATYTMEQRECQISPEQAQFIALLVKTIGAKRALEIGTFTGYSALAVAMALPDDGELVACDVSDEWTSVGRKYWEQAGVAHKIDLRLAPALDTLATLEADSAQRASFDYAFIDADKLNYDAYYEACLKLVRPGGLITLDNMLQGGRVSDARRQDDSVVAIRALNKKLHEDERVDVCLVPIGDGLTLARKR